MLFKFSPCHAQSCQENLYNAGKLLESGNADACLDLIRYCVNKEQPQSIRWQAYRLQSLAYLMRLQSDSARIAAENMLDLHPTYAPNLRTDPMEFSQLISKIVVIPKFTLGLAISAGTNSTFPVVSKGYIVADYKKKYSSKNGLQFGSNIGFQITPNLAAETGLLSTVKKYQISYEFAGWKVDYYEKMNYLDIPFTLKYLMNAKKIFRPFVQGGFVLGYLMYDQNSFRSEYTPTQKVNELENLDGMDRRHRTNVGWTLGTGVFYKLNKGHISLQSNYYHSLRKINIAAKRFDYTEQIFTYFYQDDDLRLHNLAVSLGGMYYLNYKVYREKKKNK